MEDNQNQLLQTSSTPTSLEAEVPKTVEEEIRETERRQHTRYPVSASLEAVELQSKARFSGRISDLSMGGCYVDTIAALPVGSILKIRLALDGKFFETRAKVIVSSPGMGMGLMFTETEPDQLDTLKLWIRELSGELQPCEPELPEIRNEQAAVPGSNVALVDALNELVIELMRMGVLSDLKGKAILQKTLTIHDAITTSKPQTSARPSVRSRSVVRMRSGVDFPAL